MPPLMADRLSRVHRNSPRSDHAPRAELPPAQRAVVRPAAPKWSPRRALPSIPRCLPLLVLSAMLLGSGTTRAADPFADTGRTWAVLIGIERYETAPRLRFLVNDVTRLSQTLRDRGNYEPACILELTDTAQDSACRPNRQNLLKQIPHWLAQVQSEDRLLILFSGHGLRDDQRRYFLVPSDGNPGAPESTCLAVETLRQWIDQSPAQSKLLVLDTGHVEHETATSAAPFVAAGEIADQLRGTARLSILASCAFGEPSLPWIERERSLFSYHLEQGLRGAADEDDDATVDLDELDRYVRRQVIRTARNRFSRGQTPALVVPARHKPFTVVHIEPQPLRRVLADFSEHFATALQERKLSRTGVLPFTSQSPQGEVVGGDFGLLGHWCGSELERLLIDQSSQRYQVVGGRVLQHGLQEQRLSVADLGSPTALAELSARVGGMPALVLGSIRGRDAHRVTLTCELIATASGEVVASARAVAALTDQDWAMIGRSVRVPADPPALKVQPVEHVITRLDERSRDGHPLADPNFPFPVRVIVNGAVRAGVFRGNEYLVPVTAGETYAIRVENKSGQVAAMRLLVDGLNTLPERRIVDGQSVLQMAQRVHLDEARHFVLDPAERTRWELRGFVAETGAAGRLQEFTVVRAEDSLAARQQFHDQIGLITAAFYAERPPARSASDELLAGRKGEVRLGTAAGRERIEDLTSRNHSAVGPLLAVVHIGYVDAAALHRRNAQLPRPQSARLDSDPPLLETVNLTRPAAQNAAGQPPLPVAPSAPAARPAPPRRHSCLFGSCRFGR